MPSDPVARQLEAPEANIALTGRGNNLFTPEQEDTLRPLLDVLVPAEGSWPAASHVVERGRLEDRCARDLALRDAVLGVLDDLSDLAVAEGARSFAELSPEAREEMVCQVEAASARLFKKFVDFVYEAYYAAPAVQQVVEQRTGFRIRAAIDGVSVAQFEEVLLKVADVAERGKRVREVEGVR